MGARVAKVAELSAVDPLVFWPRGELAVFPTDTVYGLGARPDDAEAIEKLRAFKARPRPRPFSLHLGTVEALFAFCRDLDDFQRAWIEENLPGPATAILPASARAPQDAVLNGKVGLRVPGGRSFQAVFRAFGPLLATSVNRRGRPPLSKPGEIGESCGEEIAALIVTEEPLSGHSSRVVDLSASPPRVLRDGLVGGPR